MKKSEVLCLKLCYLHPIIQINDKVNYDCKYYMIWTNQYNAHIDNLIGISKQFINNYTISIDEYHNWKIGKDVTKNSFYINYL